MLRKRREKLAIPLDSKLPELNAIRIRFPEKIENFAAECGSPRAPKFQIRVYLGPATLNAFLFVIDVTQALLYRSQWKRRSAH